MEILAKNVLAQKLLPWNCSYSAKFTGIKDISPKITSSPKLWAANYNL